RVDPGMQAGDVGHVEPVAGALDELLERGVPGLDHQVARAHRRRAAVRAPLRARSGGPAGVPRGPGVEQEREEAPALDQRNAPASAAARSAASPPTASGSIASGPRPRPSPRPVIRSDPSPANAEAYAQTTLASNEPANPRELASARRPSTSE